MSSGMIVTQSLCARWEGDATARVRSVARHCARHCVSLLIALRRVACDCAGLACSPPGSSQKKEKPGFGLASAGLFWFCFFLVLLFAFAASCFDAFSVPGRRPGLLLETLRGLRA